MGDFSPYETLGVTESASFEEIQTAKQNLERLHEGETKLLETIDMAYDAIIMERLRLRQEGKIKVPEQIRFPEKVTPAPKLSPNYPRINAQTPPWLQNVVDQPTVKEIAVSGSIFTVLTGISLFSQDPQTLPLLLTLGVATSCVILLRKNGRFWRAVGLTFASFVVGVLFSSLIFNLLVNSGLMINFSSEQFVSFITFFLLWLVSNFTR
ncbi:MAG: CPP1-like family protein [Cyanobacterium sp. T60_A2020_053]|nr:CPP1-like family protein [Cyanobacterium sp. T60_A2020_053]